MRTSMNTATAMLLAASVAVPAYAVVPLRTFSTTGGAIPTQVATPGKTATRAAAKGTTTTGVGQPDQPAAPGAVFVKPAVPSIGLQQFDTNGTGILVAASVDVLNVATSVLTQVKSSVSSNGTGRTATANSKDWIGQISGTGFTTISGAKISSSSTCGTGSGQTACSVNFNNGTASSGTISGSANIAGASLGAYAGTGTIFLDRTADGISSVTTGARATNAMSQSTYSFTGGSYTINYDYLKFSKPSLASAFIMTNESLDFGRIAPNSGPISLTFTLNNVADSNPGHQAAMSLISVSQLLAPAPFTTNASPFTNLAEGGTQSFTVSFNPLTRGTYTQIFRFNLADYVDAAMYPGAIGKRDYISKPSMYTLDLAVTGATIPEPATWATLVMGFGLIGFSARRRRGKVVAA